MEQARHGEGGVLAWVNLGIGVGVCSYAGFQADYRQMNARIPLA